MAANLAIALYKDKVFTTPLTRMCAQCSNGKI